MGLISEVIVKLQVEKIIIITPKPSQYSLDVLFVDNSHLNWYLKLLL